MPLAKTWTDTVDRGVTDPSWDEYDALIRSEVDGYKNRLGLSVPDWRIFKAQVWTETGAANPEWKTRPMRIGVSHDLGIITLREHKENSDRIMSVSLMQDLERGRPINDPNFNVQLGLAYAYTELSTFGTVVTEPKLLIYKVLSGDNVEKIAPKLGTTQSNIFSLNPNAKLGIFANQTLYYQKANIKPISIFVSPQQLAIKYNKTGDANYADKVSYCFQIILSLKR